MFRKWKHNVQPVSNRLFRWSWRIPLDWFDALCIVIVRVIAPPKNAEWKQALRASLLLSLLCGAAYAFATGPKRGIEIALAIAFFVSFTAIAFARVGAIVDVATEQRFFGLAKTEQPDVPEYSYSVILVSLFLLVAIPIAILAMDRLGWIMFQHGSDSGSIGDFGGQNLVLISLFLTDQLIRAAFLDFFEIYGLSLSDVAETTIADRHVSFSIRTIFSLVLLAGLFRLSGLGARREQIRLALAELPESPKRAILLGKRMVRRLRRYYTLKPKTSWVGEIHYGPGNALIALAEIQGDNALPFIEPMLHDDQRDRWAAEALLRVRTPNALRILLSHPRLWNEVLIKPRVRLRQEDRSDVPMVVLLSDFAPAINKAQEKALLSKAVSVYRNWNADDCAKSCLLQMIALSAGRFRTGFSYDPDLKWQAKEVGFGASQGESSQTPIYSDELRDFFIEILCDRSSVQLYFAALCALDWLGVPASAKYFEEAINSGGPAVRSRGIIGLARCGGKSDPNPILNVLSRVQSEPERYIAVWALGTLGNEAAAAPLFLELKQALQARFASSEIHDQCIRSLANLGPSVRRRMLSEATNFVQDWTRRLLVREAVAREPDLKDGEARRFLQDESLLVASEVVHAGPVPQTVSFRNDIEKSLSEIAARIRISLNGKKPDDVPGLSLDLQGAAQKLISAHSKAFGNTRQTSGRKSAISAIKNLRSPVVRKLEADRNQVAQGRDVPTWVGGKEISSGAANTVGRDVNWKLYLLGVK